MVIVIDIFVKSTELISGWLESAGKRYAKLSTFQQYLYLALFLLFFIGLNLQAVEQSGDAIHKWAMARIYAADGKFPIAPDHHILRWGIMWPVIGLLKLFGDNINVYYVLPIFSYVTAGLLFYALAKQVVKAEWAIWAVALYAFSAEIIHEGTQFLPIVPAFLFILITILCLIKAVEAKKIYEALWLFGAGFALSLAFSCKETSFYWAPGIFISLAFLPTQGYKLFQFKKLHLTLGMVVFFLTCVGGLLGETLVLNAIYGSSFGRIELIQKSHFVLNKIENSVSTFEYIFSIFRHHHWNGKFFWSVIRNFGFTFGMLGCGIVLFGSSSTKVKLVAGAVVGAFLCHCYLAIEFFPFTYPEKPFLRYLSAVFVTGLLIYYYTLPTLWKWAKSGRTWRMFIFLFCNIFFIVNSIIAVVNERKNCTTPITQKESMQLVQAAYKQNYPYSVGVLTRYRNLKIINDSKAEYTKWVALYMRLYLNIDSARIARERTYDYSEAKLGDKNVVIIWLNHPPYHESDQPVILDEHHQVDYKQLTFTSRDN